MAHAQYKCLVARVLAISIAKQSRKKKLKDGRTLTRGRIIKYNSANYFFRKLLFFIITQIREKDMSLFITTKTLAKK